MESSTVDATTRLRWSLEGLATGDAFGDRFFFEGHAYQTYCLSQPYAQRPLPAGRWEYTDDTQMALSIAEILHQYQTIDQAALATSFGVRFERQRGYGSAMYDLLPQLRAGIAWQTAAAALFGGAGSYGNGAAMRVAPLGAYFADDLPTVIAQATRSAVVTHTHPEAIAGAVAIAVAAAIAWRVRQTRPLPQRTAFLDLVLPHLPESVVRTKTLHVSRLPPDSDIWSVIAVVGNGSAITAQDTVPFVLWCAAQSLDNYEQAIWDTASGMGDIDTNCAMVGGIVALVTGLDGIPERWRKLREPLPTWALNP
jgi:ADP-ribosylglycohydrolase